MSVQITEVNTETSNRSLTSRKDNPQQIGDPETILRILEDSVSRAILQEVSGEALSTKELVERCDIPQSTAYRKINDLTEAGLLNKLIRINPVGRYEYEYELGVDQMTISIESTDHPNT